MEMIIFLVVPMKMVCPLKISAYFRRYVDFIVAYVNAWVVSEKTFYLVVRETKVGAVLRQVEVLPKCPSANTHVPLQMVHIYKYGFHTCAWLLASMQHAHTNRFYSEEFYFFFQFLFK